MGRAIKWALTGEAIGVAVSAMAPALGLSVPWILLWSTVATLITAIAGS